MIMTTYGGRSLSDRGVGTERITGSRLVATMLGENWCVLVEELSAFMTYLATDGEEESSVIQNDRIVRKGRELLKLQQSSSGS